MSFKSDYIDYVRNVLGVKSIFSNSVLPEAPVEIPLVVYVQDYRSYSTTETDLLHKMLAAVKISAENIQFFDLSENVNAVSQMTIYLTDEMKPGRTLAANEIHTYSARQLLQKPAFKKAAWDELQKVLHFFQQLPGPQARPKK